MLSMFHTPRKILLVTLIGGIIASAVPATSYASTHSIATNSAKQVIKSLSTTKKVILVTALLTTFLTAFRFYMKEPSNDPVRISRQEAQELLNPKNFFAALKNDYKGTMTKLWYVLDDLIIGRAREESYVKSEKNKETLKVDLVVKPEAAPQGIIGNIHARLVPFEIAALCTAGFAVLIMSDKFAEALKYFKFDTILDVKKHLVS
jgi:hypothetical protein